MSAIDLSLASPELSLDTEWSVYTDPLGSNHLPIILTIGSQNLKPSNFSPLCSYRTNNVDWSTYKNSVNLNTTGANTDEKLYNLKTSILTAAEQTLPKNLNFKNRVLVPWWTSECKEAIRLRNRAYRAFKHSPNDINYIAYKKQRAIARRVIKDAKRSSWREFISKINIDTPVREIWNFIKLINGKSFSRPMYIKIDNKLIDDPQLIAEEIAKYFASVSADSNYSAEYIQIRSNRDAPINFSSQNQLHYNEDFTREELLFVLAKVRGTSAGPDGIKYEMVKNLTHQDKDTLLEFFNYIWRTQTFPSDWEHAITIPIHKPGKETTDVSSYRPIALTNILCKIMERLVKGRLNKFLEENIILHPMQFGFRKNRSTYHNLLSLEHDARKSLSFNNFTMAVFMDIEKAFDMCPRWGILSRLHKIGLRGNLPIFIQNFLATRYFKSWFQPIGTIYSSQWRSTGFRIKPHIVHNYAKWPSTKSTSRC